jgi:predicted dehydrogenase
MELCKPYRVGVIGLGNMGSRYLEALHANPNYTVSWVCDRNPERLAWASELIHEVIAGEDADQLIAEVEADILGVFTLADVRPHFIRAALRRRQHVIAEKPIAASIPEEEALLREIEASDRLVAVNLFNRNAWYHREIQTFIQRGEIGELAILDISHQTPGAMPNEEHGPEGPPFHDCGIHYIDLARWYANSEIGRWDAMGLRCWNWSEPWWGTAHGHFQNGIVFKVTFGFIYGQLAQTQVTQCALEAIGTLGVVRMQHNFNEVVIKYHGVTRTEETRGAYAGRTSVSFAKFLQSHWQAGRNIGFPTVRDSVIASRVAQEMLDLSRERGAPVVGTLEEMAQISLHKEALRRAQHDRQSRVS